MIRTKTKDCFWNVVEECLKIFHGIGKEDAREKVSALREKIESPAAGMSSDIFYHSEPFDVACDLAEKRLDLSDLRERYNAILDKYNW